MQLIFINLSTLCLVSFWMLSCGNSPETVSGKSNSDLFVKYDSIIQQGINQEYPGMILAVQTKDEPVWVGAAGLSNIEEQKVMLKNDRFHIASITKLFTSIVTLQLIDQGKINFDDPVINYLDFALVSEIPNIKRISLGQLLDHSSGIYSFNNDLDYLNTIIGNKADEGIRWTAKELLNLANGNRVQALGEPGSGHYYSDVNQILLALVIERITKKSFREVVNENILTPLHLTNTGFYADRMNDENFSMTTTVQGYTKRSEILDNFISVHPSFNDASPGLLNTTKAVERTDAAAGIVSTADDLATLGKALYKGSLVSPKSLDWLYAIGAGIEKEELHTEKQGIVTVRKKPHGVLYTSLGDGVGGMNTMLAYHPKSKNIVVAFTNIFGNFDEHDFFIDTVLPQIIEAGKVEYSNPK